MRTFLTISFSILLSSFLFAQDNSEQDSTLKQCGGTTFIKQFQTKEGLVTCNNCHWDECGNVISSSSDTLYKNEGSVHPDFYPIFLTYDSILLTKKNIEHFLEKNKIQSMQFLHCNEVYSQMGFLALEGVYQVQLKDTVIQTYPLVEAVKSKIQSSDIVPSQILVNGYKVYSGALKYPKSLDISIKFLDKFNEYYVLTQ